MAWLLNSSTTFNLTTKALLSVFVFILVMNAYAKSKQRDAPYMVEQLLREMHDVYEETEDIRVRPNSRSFNTCVSSKRQRFRVFDFHYLCKIC